MIERFDKSLLERLTKIQPAIDPDVLADTLCDGELLAVILDHWIVARFEEIHGLIVNVAIRSDPALPERIQRVLTEVGPNEAARQFDKYYDFEILNDPACPAGVLKYILRCLAYLWEAQARVQHPERNIKFRVEFDPNEGVEGAHYIQMEGAV